MPATQEPDLQPNLRPAFRRDGFAICEDIFSDGEITELATLLSRETPGEDGEGGPSPGSAGDRNLLQRYEAVRRLVQHHRLRTLVTRATGEELFAVRAIYFDKSPDSNWFVPWHQDLSIAVDQGEDDAPPEADAAGFRNWSVKDGVVHVQPPREILESMLAIRIHLDTNDTDNGCLEVVPGSHLYGVLDSQSRTRLISDTPEVACPVGSGGVLLMRPLLLHRSAKSRSNRRRRVIHIECARRSLPEGLQWFHQFALA
jgi:hypothetical protein